MRRNPTSINWITCLIAAIWLISGLFCKVLNLEPRHQEIVARILGHEFYYLTFWIGLAEVGMALWILSGIKKRLAAITQIIAITLMNTLEFFIAPDLLLWGKLNAIFAMGFIAVIFYNEFRPLKKTTAQAI
jgi:hypothetical protein